MTSNFTKRFSHGQTATRALLIEASGIGIERVVHGHENLNLEVPAAEPGTADDALIPTLERPMLADELFIMIFHPVITFEGTPNYHRRCGDNPIRAASIGVNESYLVGFYGEGGVDLSINTQAQLGNILPRDITVKMRALAQMPDADPNAPTECPQGFAWMVEDIDDDSDDRIPLQDYVPIASMTLNTWRLRTVTTPVTRARGATVTIGSGGTDTKTITVPEV